MKNEQIFSNFVWAVGGLTELIGQMHTSSTDESTKLHWHDDENYWLSLEMRDDGIYAEISDSTDQKTMYAAIGYCQYHSIDYILPWQEHINAQMEKKAIQDKEGSDE